MAPEWEDKNKFVKQVFNIHHTFHNLHAHACCMCILIMCITCYYADNYVYEGAIKLAHLNKNGRAYAYFSTWALASSIHLYIQLVSSNCMSYNWHFGMS